MYDGTMVAQKHQHVENFIGRYDKLSRAAMKGEVSRENTNIVVHQGSMAYNMALTEFKSVGVSETRLRTPVFLFF
jgi:hypothetical protein